MTIAEQILQMVRLYSQHKKLTRTDVETLVGVMALILAPDDCIEETKLEVMKHIFKKEKTT